MARLVTDETLEPENYTTPRDATLSTSSSDTTATTVCLILVAVILVLAAGLTPLLPRHAAADQH